jgi:hypothetical protein
MGEEDGIQEISLKEQRWLFGPPVLMIPLKRVFLFFFLFPLVFPIHAPKEKFAIVTRSVEDPCFVLGW